MTTARTCRDVAAVACLLAAVGLWLGVGVAELLHPGGSSGRAALFLIAAVLGLIAAWGGIVKLRRGRRHARECRPPRP